MFMELFSAEVSNMKPEAEHDKAQDGDMHSSYVKTRIYGEPLH
jgi:hypothetical protein